MTTERNVLGQVLPVVPDSWLGSKPEYYIYRAILRRGLREGIDFQYQRNVFGGRTRRGGAVPDFFIFVPRVGINIQGARFHTPPIGNIAFDQMQRAAIEQTGIRMEFISEEEAKVRPDEAVAEAIQGTRGRGPAESLRGF